LLLVGFAFKVALVPFHWWTPDVYDGAPTTITAFMSVATKAAAFGAFFRAFSLALPAPSFDWRVALSMIAILTMTLGNIAALLQTSIKRMLAYSSIAHAGYIMIALIATGERGMSNVLFICSHTRSPTLAHLVQSLRLAMDDASANLSLTLQARRGTIRSSPAH
jgi:NADH-quinone oxidoreductase subunit N